MDLDEWPEPELCALARVYIRRNKLHKAEPIRAELARRLSQKDSPKLRHLYNIMRPKQVTSLADRVVGLFKRAS